MHPSGVSKATKLNSRWTAVTLLVGGCAIVASAATGAAQNVNGVPEAGGYHTHVIPVHRSLPHNHTHYTAPKWHLSNVQKLHLVG